MLDNFECLFLVLDGLDQGLDIEDFSFDPVIEVVIWVPQVLAELLSLLSDLLSAFLVLQDASFFVLVDVVGQVFLLVGIDNVKPSLVVNNGLRSVDHRGLHLLEHGLQHGHHLLCKNAELLALSVELILLNGVVHVRFNFQSLLISIDNVSIAKSRKFGYSFFDICSVWSRKNLEFLCIDNK